MARVDLKNKTIHAKLVYYGPGLCGKTTNLQVASRLLGKGQELMSLATEGDRTIFFDFMPLDLGKLRGMDVQFKLYTVPGQVRYNQTRKMVLKNVDGIVFVADSQPQMMDGNLESFANLFDNLLELGIAADSLAIVLQYNKRDLPGVLSKKELDSQLNDQEFPTLLASAHSGEGVVETLKTACQAVLARLAKTLPDTGKIKATAKGKEFSAKETMPEGAPVELAQARPVPRTRTTMRAGRPSQRPTVVVKKSESAPDLHAPEPVEASPEPVASAPAPQTESPESLRVLERALVEATRLIAEIKGELIAIRADRPSAPDAAPLASLVTKADFEKVSREAPTKADLEMLRKRVDLLVARSVDSAKTDPELVKKELLALGDRLGKLPTKEDLLQLSREKTAQPSAGVATGELQQAMTEVVKRIDQLKSAATPATREDVLTKADLLAFARQVPTKDDLLQLSRERTAQPSTGAQDVLTKADLLAFARQVPAKEDLERLRASVATTLEEHAREDKARASEAQSTLATRADLAALSARLNELPTSTQIEKLRERATDSAPSAEVRELANAISQLARKEDLDALRDEIRALSSALTALAREPEQLAKKQPTLEAPPNSAEPKAPVATAEPAAATKSERPPEPAPEAPTAAAETAPSKSEPSPAPSESARAAQTPAEPAVIAAAAEESVEAVSPPPPPEPEPEAEPEVAASPAEPAKSAEPETAETDEYAEDPRHRNAARVARVMMADLYLYNKEQVEEGIRQNDFYERNKEAIADVRLTYESRIPEDVRRARDYLQHAIDDLIRKKKDKLTQAAGSEPAKEPSLEPTEEKGAQAERVAEPSAETPPAEGAAESEEPAKPRKPTNSVWPPVLDAAGAEAPKAEAKSEAETEAKPEAEAEAKPEAEAETKTEAEAETKTEAEAETKTEAEAETKTEAGAETKTEAGAETKTEAEAETKTEAEAETKTEAGAEAKPEVVAEAAAAEPPAAEDANDPRHQNASRVARVMVSDLYLYNKEGVDEGIRNNDFYERNKEALADMRLTYESRVNAEVRAARDFLQLAIDDLIKKKRKHLGLDP